MRWCSYVKSHQHYLSTTHYHDRLQPRPIKETSWHLQPWMLQQKPVFWAKTSSFPNPSQVMFVPKPNLIISTMENLLFNLKKQRSKIWWFAETYNANIYCDNRVVTQLSFSAIFFQLSFWGSNLVVNIPTQNTGTRIKWRTVPKRTNGEWFQTQSLRSLIHAGTLGKALQ